MQITIQYEAQARRAAGVGSEALEVEDNSDVSHCIRRAAETHGEQLKPILLDADGNVQSGLLVFLNDSQIGRQEPQQLSDGDTLTLMPPISGG